MRRFLLALTLLTAPFLLPAGAAASKVKIVHSFCALKDCKFGSGPGGLAQDSQGNLYGTTAGESGFRPEIIYELVGRRKYQYLYAFCPRNDCSTGQLPSGPLVIDTAGNLYGVARLGGAQNRGTVFELSPDADHSQWSIKVLYNFCAENQCADGDDPYGGLTYKGASSGAPYDGVSPLYGTTTSGGAGQGLAFQLTPGEQGWTETVIHTFCGSGGQCADGARPDSIFADTAGNLFGTAGAGGGSGGGLVFRLDAGTWAETVLYSFCALKKCADGWAPQGLSLDPSGVIYGTTAGGGRPCRIANLQGYTCGLIYQLVPNGNGWQENVLYAFCSQKDCKDGAVPITPLLTDPSGNLFGQTIYGGGNDVDPNAHGGGVVFELGATGFKVLHSFCSQGGSACTDGMYPSGNLVMDASGYVFGTTGGGGADGSGEVFRLTP